MELIKPVMLGKLIQIRNAVEHQFSDPPTQDSCIELAEFVWYFLRSTDSIAQRVSGGPYLQESYDSRYIVAFKGTPHNEWESTISAHLAGSLTSLAPHENYFEVIDATVQTGYDYKLTNSGSPFLSDYRDDDVILNGKIKDRNVEMCFLRLYFRTT